MAEQRFALGTFSRAEGAPFAGVVLGDEVIAAADFGVPGSLLSILEGWHDALPRFSSIPAAAQRHRVADLRAHAPYVPRQIFAMAANYRKHVIELVLGDPDMRGNEMAGLDEAGRRRAAEAMMDERAASAQPYCFNKLPSSIAGPDDPLVLPRDAEKIDWECELVVVIGRPARHVAAADAARYIAAYAMANDVTDRALVFRRDVKVLGADWLASKSQPGFTPFGPYIVPAQFVEPYDLNVRLAVNGRLMQNETTADMLIRIDRQIEYLSSRVQLLPGDMLLTGSPAGNGSHHGVFLRPGDTMIASITGLGTQTVRCVGG